MKLSLSFVYMCVVSYNPAFYTKSFNHKFGSGNQLRCRKKGKRYISRAKLRTFILTIETGLVLEIS